jgi:hypothetical protein
MLGLVKGNPLARAAEWRAIAAANRTRAEEVRKLDVDSAAKIALDCENAAAAAQKWEDLYASAA